MVSPDQLVKRAWALAPVAEIGSCVAGFGGDVYLVGGAVRDLILGRDPVDVDLAIDGDAADLASRLGTASAAPTKFGTLSVQRGLHRYDLARTRGEAYAHPGALPEVEPAGIETDLRRRDFTVNAIALGLHGTRRGEMLSPPGALDDLQSGRLAVLHEASFADDPTRLFRLARYAARLRFEPAPHTRELAAAALAGGALQTISGPRIGNELRLLAAEADPIAAFGSAQDLGLPGTIDAGAAAEALRVLPDDGRPDRVVLACVFRGRSSQKLRDELDGLGFTAAEREAIVEGATASAGLARRLSEATSRSAIAKAVGSAGIETVALALAHSPSAESWQALAWLQELRHLRLQISGEDLLDRGLSQGPAIGTALQAARAALLDGQAPDRESQLAVALRAAE
jgi:tRNA nucleotidyltransferase (CCA-adding enzyme)